MRSMTAESLREDIERLKALVFRIRQRRSACSTITDAGAIDRVIERVRAMEAMRIACEAHAAWSWAESKRLSESSFNERMELCKYAEWLTACALSIESGDPSGEEYRGVKHLIVWPNVHIQQASGAAAQDLVDDLIADWRAALAKKGSP